MKIQNSIIVPAYNEEKRSGSFIPLLLSYVKKHIPHSEVLIVNDGSKDNTVAVVNAFIKKTNTGSFAKVIGYSVNKGKGNAVTYGVHAAKGQKVLFIDADGSIAPDEIPRMLEKLDSYEVVVGDRHSARSKVKTTIIRKITSLGFNSLVSLIFQYSYRDNLCGFKGFTRKAANVLFSDLKDRRWVFDVELFFKIKRKYFSLYFLPIKWHHVEGSKISLFKDSIKWFARLVTLRFQLINYR
ncbi:MAG TPA: glycosyltransferase [Candidatus Nanoarchaeia archaeon]|nr:glycosyltransferase [Candidatus Nanoarchaeia archaeon]